jgi:opacity protein-like surface antigen
MEMMMIIKTTMRRLFLIFVFAILFAVSSAHNVAAEGFVSPFIGYNFGGDTGCPTVTNCDDKHANYGVSLGAIGSIVGFELEFAHTNDFFGQSSESSSVLTLMSNLMVGPKISAVQPYVVVGLGLIRTSVSDSSNDQNQFGWDVGGGIIGMFSKHVGIRGDIRYYRSFQILDFSNLPPNSPVAGLGGNKLDFGRAAIAAMFKF